MDKNQSRNAKIFKDAIQKGNSTIIPEIWDVVSANVMFDAGFRMLSTSSTAIGWVNGTKPQQIANPEECLLVAGRIVRDFNVPVNAHVGRALDYSVNMIKKVVRAAIEIGCAGITMGDGKRVGAFGIANESKMCNRIKAAKLAIMQAGVPIVLTVQTESYVFRPAGGDPSHEIELRANAYFEAGADCIVISGLEDVELITNLTKVFNHPVAITVSFDRVSDLGAYSGMGLAWVSPGTDLLRFVVGQVHSTASKLVKSGAFQNRDRLISNGDLARLLR